MFSKQQSFFTQEASSKTQGSQSLFSPLLKQGENKGLQNIQTQQQEAHSHLIPQDHVSLDHDPKLDVDIEIIKDEFTTWRNKSLFLIFRKVIREEFSSKTSYSGTWARKRGNSVYRMWAKNRFEQFIVDLPDYEFFNTRDHDLRNAKSPLLMITLTYDTKRCNFSEAWENIGNEYNRYLSYLKRRFGRIRVLRTWESYDSGYPHVHSVVMFLDREFSVAYCQKTEGRKAYRIVSSDKQIIQKGWHSFVDVQACYNLSGALCYIGKYISKDLFSKKPASIITLAMTWKFNKRVFSFSKGFFARLDYNVHNSNFSVQKNLNGDTITEISFHLLGIVTFDFLRSCLKDVNHEKLKFRFGKKLPILLKREFSARKRYEELTFRHWSSYRSILLEGDFDLALDKKQLEVLENEKI